MPQEVPGRKQLVDVQGTLYSLLRRPYFNYDDEEAHRIILHGLEKLFNPPACILCFDGEQDLEKCRVCPARPKQETRTGEGYKTLGTARG